MGLFITEALSDAGILPGDQIMQVRTIRHYTTLVAH